MDVPGMRTCTREDCQRPHRAKGLCATHYRHEHGRSDRYEDVPCAHCGTVVRKKVAPYRKFRYCSSRCLAAHQSYRRSSGDESPACRVPDDHPAFWIGNHTVVEYGTCPVCDILHVSPSRSPRRYCSPTCRNRSHDRRRARRTRARKALAPKRMVFISGACACCGTYATVYVPASAASGVTLTCSDRCGKRMAKDRRRALEKAAFVEHVYRSKVFERDGWICQLCGKPALPDAKVPHPLAPTIDHIVPLSPYLDRPGGEHSMANVQTAHFLCNSRKSHLV